MAISLEESILKVAARSLMERHQRRLAVTGSHTRPTVPGTVDPLRCSPSSISPSAASAGDDGCVFCKIVGGESPAFKLYEDDICLCILDSNPLSKGHSLILPKLHFSSLEVTPPSVASEECLYKQSVGGYGNHLFKYHMQIVAAMSSAVPFLSKAIMKATHCDSFNLLVNSGSAAGQVIFHTHFHIIPRKAGDQLWPSEGVRRCLIENNEETFDLVRCIRQRLEFSTEAVFG
ncbi:adenylylsulfatase HINT3-like isoform X1 [Dioscorea cayenensis subsp. rotundata]|uniref:Adenylylsulfatase HINT3-like isoform X1 n=1 Tax=Dioscorea cayennensis subsp. rotundata TaxID=55577 RepID=A0AB40B928_DIOCR|nr:adenylylsulfatase HINT3-like isoform X1 [Dioscorea cayenensis subsp. rotundata]